MTLATLKTATLNVTAEKTIGTLVTGGATVDTIEGAAVTTGTISGTLGAGLAAATVALDGGAGTDTIDMLTTTDTSSVTTWATTGIENLTVTDLAGTGAIVANALTLLGSQADDFSSVAITADANGDTDDTLAISITTDKATTDLSGLVVADTTAITGVAGTAETITGTNVKDTIVAGGAAKADVVSQKFAIIRINNKWMHI